MTTRLGLFLSLILTSIVVFHGSSLNVIDKTALAQQGCGCPIQPLTPLSDPVAQDFENGNTINTDNLTQGMKDALSCFQNAVQGANGTFILNSAYRPTEYQEHLREVWDKHNELRNVRGGLRVQACADLRRQVDAEFAKHTLMESQRPAGPSGQHIQGGAIDVTVDSSRTGLPLQTLLNLADGCNLQRPHLPRDPVHFELKATR